MKKLSLIVATYNRAQQVLETLGSVVLQSADPELWECVVVNNNSKDDTIEQVECFISNHSQFDIRIVTELRQGLSHARNCGIESSSAPIIAIIDDDELIVPELISSYIEFFDSHPEVASAGGAIVARYRTSRPKWISKYTEKPIANPLDLGSVARRFPKGVIPGGGNMALRRSVIERLGAFDPELGRCGEKLIGGEENNLFERLHRAGEQTWWVPGAVMYHLIPDEKLQRSYLDKLWFNIGVSHSQRARIEGVSRVVVMMKELFKWGGTLVIALGLLLSIRASGAYYLLLMRWYITRGILRG